MKLGDKQRLFVRLVSKLLEYGHAHGYEFTFGEAFRPAVTAAIYQQKGTGIKNSLHTVRLAIDLNVFKNGTYLVRGEDFKELGEFWESIGGTWGGRFKDGNHFSLSHDVDGDGISEK